MLAPFIAHHPSDRSEMAGAVLLILIGVFLVFAPLIAPLASLLDMHSVDPPLPILLCIFLAYQLALPRLTAEDFSWSERLADSSPIFLIVTYAALLSWLSIRKHEVIDSHTDLAIFDNLMWNTIHGRVLYSSLLQRNFLGEHVSPILLMLTPIYWLAPNASTLLILQSCALASSAIPVYWLAKEHLEARPALVLLVLYFFNRSILGAAFFDFHEIVFAVPLIAFAFYFCEHRRNGLFVLMLLGAMLCKEEVALIVAAFGIYLWVQRGRSPLAIGLIIVGLAVFLADYNIVLPYFRGRPGPYADRYSYLGSSIPAIIGNMIRHPLYVAANIFTLPKLTYLCVLFGSLAFLPFLALEYLIPVAPTFLRVTLSGLVPEYSFDFHYSAPLCPFLFFAAIFGAERLSRILSESAADSVTAIRDGIRGLAGRSSFLRRQMAYISTQDLIMTVVLICGGLFGMNPLRFANSPKAASDVSSLDAIRRELPPGASLAGDETLIAHFSHRRDLAFLPIVNNADYVLMDFAGDRFEYPLSRQEHRRQLLSLAFGGGYGVKLNTAGVVLLQRGMQQTPQESARLIAPIFFKYPRSQIQSRRCHTCSAGFDRAAFTLGHLYPPGQYVAMFKLHAAKSSSEKIELDVHANQYVKKGEIQYEDQTHVVRKEVQIESGTMIVPVPFSNTDWEVLLFRALLPVRSGVSLASVEVQPAVPLEQTLQELKTY